MPDESENPYDILRVAEDATDAEVKRRYHEAVKDCHTDVNQQGDEERLRKVNRAYEELRTEGRRKAFSERRARDQAKARAAEAAAARRARAPNAARSRAYGDRFRAEARPGSSSAPPPPRPSSGERQQPQGAPRPRTSSGEPRRGAHPPTATPSPPTTSPSSTPPTRRRYHRLSEVIGRTIRTHLLIPAVASVVGSIWAESTLQTSEYSQPYGKAIVLLATIGCVTGIPALAASLVFDVSAWQRGAARFAIVDIPEWHRHLLFASAILPPAVYLVAHWGEKFADYGPRYGPPQLFWWLAPVGLLVAHLAALCRRAMTER
jgi:DnaJ domain